MPLFEFKCATCGRVEEKLFASYEAMQREPKRACSRPSKVCTGVMQRQISAPSSVIVHGFNSINGYSGARTITQQRGSTKIEVSGNFEAFADGLTK